MGLKKQRYTLYCTMAVTVVLILAPIVSAEIIDRESSAATHVGSVFFVDRRHSSGSQVVKSGGTVWSADRTW